MAAKESKFCDETLQVLKKQLKCQVCKSGPRPDKMTWYKCQNGHAFCEECDNEIEIELVRFDTVDRDALEDGFWVTDEGGLDYIKGTKATVVIDYMKLCPLGQSCIISNEPCELIGGLLNMKSMRFSCINESKGCKELLGKEAMILHESECIQNYRLVACPREHEPILKMPFHELLDHLTQRHDETIHKLSFNEKLMQDIYFYNGAHYSTMWLYYANATLEIDGKTFIHSMREICTRNGQFSVDSKGGEVVPKAQIYQWIHYVGSPKEAENYTYTLEYYGIDGRTSTYTGQVISIDEDFESIVSNHTSVNGFNCPFVIDFGIFERKFINDRKIKYSIMIRNLKEEVKDGNAQICNPKEEVKDKNANPESNK